LREVGAVVRGVAVPADQDDGTLEPRLPQRLGRGVAGRAGPDDDDLPSSFDNGHWFIMRAGPDRVGKDDLATSLATAALLVDAVRRRIYRFVRRARRPVTRDEAAAATRVSR